MGAIKREQHVMQSTAWCTDASKGRVHALIVRRSQQPNTASIAKLTDLESTRSVNMVGKEQSMVLKAKGSG
eukprot:2889881-Amphidinium_carterae.1